MDQGILGGCFGSRMRREKGLGEPPTRCEADRAADPRHRRGGRPCVSCPKVPVDKDAAGDSRRGTRHLRPHTPHSVNPLSTIAHLSFAGLARLLTPPRGLLAHPYPTPRLHRGRLHREAREEAKSAGRTAWLGRTSFFGLSRLGNGADLSHQAKLVLAVP